MCIQSLISIRNERAYEFISMNNILLGKKSKNKMYLDSK